MLIRRYRSCKNARSGVKRFSTTAGVIEGLFASDLAFLQDLYRRINSEGHTTASVTCPSCHEEFAVDLAGGPPGES